MFYDNVVFEVMLRKLTDGYFSYFIITTLKTVCYNHQQFKIT